MSAGPGASRQQRKISTGPTLWPWKLTSAQAKSRWRFAAMFCDSVSDVGHIICCFIFLVFPSLLFLSLFPFFSSFFPVVLLCAAILLSQNQLRSDLWKYVDKEPWAAATVPVLNLVNLHFRVQ